MLAAPGHPRPTPQDIDEHPVRDQGDLHLLLPFSNIPMDFVRAGEALLRSSQPLLPFLAPSAHRSASRRIANLPRQCLRQPQPSRTLTTSAQRRAEDDDVLTGLLDQTMKQDKRNPTGGIGRTSRSGSNRAQQENRTMGPSERVAAARNQSSFEDMVSRFGTNTPQPRHSSNDPRSDDFNLDYALDPNRPQDGISTTPKAPSKPPYKLNSTVGRTIAVNENKGIDVGRAFRTLEARCAQNSVKRDHMRQRYHERPGLKRKRLASERWRRRFKESFRATIKLVQGLKKQGW